MGRGFESNRMMEEDYEEQGVSECEEWKSLDEEEETRNQGSHNISLKHGEKKLPPKEKQQLRTKGELNNET